MSAGGALDEVAGAALVGLVEANQPAAMLGALKMLGNILDKLAGGDFAKFGTLKTSAPALQAKLLSLTGGAQALTALGFETDEAAGTYIWPEALGAATAASRAAAVRAALLDLETLRDAITAVGDSNPPAVATAAVKLMGTYLGNLLAQPTEERRRVQPSRRPVSPHKQAPSPQPPPTPTHPSPLPPPRLQIGGANKTLHARLLSAQGGASLLSASGFLPSTATDPSGHPSSYACATSVVAISLSFSLLSRAGDVWAAMADERAAAGTGGNTERGAGARPPLAPEVPSTAVTEFRLESLPEASALGQAPPPAADMQPALARADGGKRITLHAWQVRGS
jgi:hypothetical protein